MRIDDDGAGGGGAVRETYSAFIAHLTRFPLLINHTHTLSPSRPHNGTLS